MVRLAPSLTTRCCSTPSSFSACKVRIPSIGPDEPDSPTTIRTLPPAVLTDLRWTALELVIPPGAELHSDRFCLSMGCYARRSTEWNGSSPEISALPQAKQTGGEWGAGFRYEAVPPRRNPRDELQTTPRHPLETCVADLSLPGGCLYASPREDAAAYPGQTAGGPD